MTFSVDKSTGYYVNHNDDSNFAFDDSSHNNNVIMSAMASLITSLTNVYSTVYSGGLMKENIKAPRRARLWGNSPVISEFPAQMANNAENVAMLMTPS